MQKAAERDRAALLAGDQQVIKKKKEEYGTLHFFFHFLFFVADLFVCWLFKNKFSERKRKC
jgi:hypothetical protein